MILVTGATGTIGREVVQQLAARGQRVRALTRSQSSFAAGVEVARADLARPETLEKAFHGIEKLFLASNGPQLLELEENALQAAHQAGVTQVVKLSGRHIDARFMQEIPLADWHRRSELRLRELIVNWTILRPGMFASNLLLWLDREQKALCLPVGQGRDTPTDPRDIASIAVEALLHPGHAGQVYDITGPEFLTYHEMAEKLGAALGTPVRLMDIDSKQCRAGLIAAGVPEPQADALVLYFAAVREGLIYSPTRTAQDILGRPPRSLDQWLADEKVRFFS